MDYQTSRPIGKTRQNNKQNQPNRNTFANQNYGIFAINNFSKQKAKTSL